ncbi:MAG: serine/threonine protein kinase [Chitinophagaceae bacterium]|nr:MAG: serine/threonine protein kinase [Chitinophagaceae bacterium]
MHSNNQMVTDIAGYRLVRKLGSGGMGDVYEAYHHGLARTAAIKVLHQPDMAERFRNEAYIQSAINHPNIARLYEFTTAADKPCIIMEYVNGENLDDLLRRKTRLDNDEAASILKQIAAALSYLHEKQILHRDIKPQNFKVQQDGTVKMLDFGIAKHRYSPKFTREGFIVGTTEYMAPEQFSQKPEMRSDVWSFGVLAYEMLTGYMPFESGEPVVQRARLQIGTYTDPKILVPALSQNMASVIEKCLRVSSKSRATSAEIYDLLSGTEKDSDQFVRFRKLAEKYRKEISIVAGALVFIFFITLINGNNNVPAEEIMPEDNVDANNTGKSQRKVTINVPGVTEAFVNFPDGRKYDAPYDLKGKDGEQFNFTISARGYRDKPVQLEMRMGPQTYDFILEKIN